MPKDSTDKVDDRGVHHTPAPRIKDRTPQEVIRTLIDNNLFDQPEEVQRETCLSHGVDYEEYREALRKLGLIK